MRAVNSNLLELIELEISQCNQSNYYKTIPYTNYNLSTKLALDLLIEKYGGFIYRDESKITLFINFSNFNRNHHAEKKELENRLVELEETIENLKSYITTIDRHQSEKQKEPEPVTDAINYYKEVERSADSLRRLIAEVNEKK